MSRTFPANLSLYALRCANRRRQALWDVEQELRGAMGLLYRSNELGGEVGEALNKVKKYVRQMLGIRGSTTTLLEIADELADVVICVDLLADDLNIDLASAVRNKFNLTSTERGYPVQLRLQDTVFVGNQEIKWYEGEAQA